MVRKIDSMLFCQNTELSELWRTHWNLVQTEPFQPKAHYIVRIQGSYEVGAWIASRFAHQFSDSQDTWIFHCSVCLPIIWDNFTESGTIVRRYSTIVFQWKDNGVVQVELYYNTDAHRFEIYRGPRDSGVLIGVTENLGALIPSERSFGDIIWRIKIHNTQGEYDVVWNGRTVGSGRNLNTQATGNASANQIYVGDFVGEQLAPRAQIHNVLICDGQGGPPANGIVGHVRVKGMYPNEAGTYTEWIPEGFTTINANWYKVSFRSPQTAQYNWAPEIGAVDTYGVETSYYPPIEAPSPPAFQGNCFAICIHPIAYNAVPPGSIFTPAPESDGVIKAVLMIGTNREDGPSETLDTTYKGYPWILTTNPFTGRAFTEEDLTNLQAGITLVS